MVRTETMRAHRTAALAAFEQSGVVRGWRWSAAHKANTCAACLALDGRVFPLRARMKAHPNCRCICTPVLINEKDLPHYQTGKQWLARQPPEVQDGILGKAGGAAYRRGDVTLDDFVGIQHSDVWGDSYVARTPNLRMTLHDPLDPKGLEVVRWKPAMTTKEADIWSQGSKLPDAYYHGTTVDAATSIKQGGFDLSRMTNGRSFGDGVYMANKDMAGQYAIGDAGSSVLKLKVNVQNPATYTEFFEGPDPSNWGRVETITDALTAKKTELEGRLANPNIDPKLAQTIAKTLQQPKYLDPQGYAQTQVMEEAGYDSLIVDNMPGSNFVVVFDPKNVTVVDDE